MPLLLTHFILKTYIFVWFSGFSQREMSVTDSDETIQCFFSLKISKRKYLETDFFSIFSTWHEILSSVVWWKIDLRKISSWAWYLENNEENWEAVKVKPSQDFHLVCLLFWKSYNWLLKLQNALFASFVGFSNFWRGRENGIGLTTIDAFRSLEPCVLFWFSKISKILGSNSVF